MEDAYFNLIVTPEFGRSLLALDPGLSDQEAQGILEALERLDSRPADIIVTNRLHKLDRELDGWWSLTPPSPPSTPLRILVRPELMPNGKGVWRVGPVTWHYRRGAQA